MGRAPMLVVMASVALGIVVGEYATLSVVGALVGLCSAVVMASWALWRRAYYAVCALFLFFWLGVFTVASYTANQATPAPSCEDNDHQIELLVDGPMHRQWSPAEINVRFEAWVVGEQCHGLWQRRGERAAVLVRGDAALARGDIIIVRARLRAFRERLNLADESLQEKLYRTGIATSVTTALPPVHLSYGEGLWAQLDRAREVVSRRLERGLSPKTHALAKALALGDVSCLGVERRELWSDAGVAHLLAISGLHVSGLAWIVFHVFYFFISRSAFVCERYCASRFAAAASIVPIVFFCAWVGSPPSALRATVMVVAYLLGRSLATPSGALNSLGAAGAGMLLVSPATLHDLGFCLSFSAVLALLLVPLSAGGAGIWRWTKSMVWTSCVATLATAPFLAEAFGRVSLIGVVSNLVAVPIGSFALTPVALLFAAFGDVSIVGPCLGKILEGVGFLLDGFVEHVGALEFAALDIAPSSKPQWMAYLVVLVMGVLLAQGRLVGRSRRRAIGFGALACLVIVLEVLRVVHTRYVGDGALTLHFPYVGQGDGALVTFPHGGVMVVDAGGRVGPGVWDPGQFVMAPLLRRMSIRSIDMAVVTHAHPDHVGGMVYLAQHFPIKELWWNGQHGDNPIMLKVIEAVTKRGGRVVQVKDLAPWIVFETTRIDIMHPRPQDEAFYSHLGLNDNSVVLRLTQGSSTALLTGDIESAGEDILSGAIGHVDVVKVAHHGSATSSTQAFVAETSPAFAVMSLGVDNIFGFPAAQVQERYHAQGTRIWRTDRHGMVRAQTKGHSWVVESVNQAP